ncbi:unnamed protein product (macronuclear) [Paramecium tetraurelia]|uniref:Uncharacterized protein n=1 Tax=Paramecium tetraurelia TaxID=5888 RepID=A0CVQ1_PARTE|nr:uncharacterized protein GSPATT00011036001 [Paramecium tetraurelia]CAK74868.1 unnamed protein product [Paramecium tetraurelia]|eukprot:XP_001442265.1 hypothetical protein (macronuclear) [Paramecium tetraurelia strain d4-2]
MKKNVGSSSTPNSKKKLTMDFQQDQSQQQPQTSQFISIEDQSQGDQPKNDESIINNDFTQACSTNLVQQENQDNLDNQMGDTNDDDAKINADSNIVNSGETDKLNLINHQIENNLINEISQNESIVVQNQNPDQYQNLKQEKSQYFNPLENEDTIQQTKKERQQFSNKKKITIEINNDEIDIYKQDIDSAQQINSQLSLRLQQEQTNNLVQQQDIEGSLEDNQEQKLIQLEDIIENDLKMQTQIAEGDRQDVEVDNCDKTEENNCQESIEEDTKNVNTQIISEQLRQIEKGSSEQGEHLPDLSQEIKQDNQEVEQQQSNQIQIEDYQNISEEELQQNCFKRENSFENEKKGELEQLDELINEDASQEIVKAKTDEASINQQENNEIKEDNESKSSDKIIQETQKSIEQPNLLEDDTEMKQESQDRVQESQCNKKELTTEVEDNKQSQNQDKDEQHNQDENQENSQCEIQQNSQSEDEQNKQDEYKGNSQGEEEQKYSQNENRLNSSDDKQFQFADSTDQKKSIRESNLQIIQVDEENREENQIEINEDQGESNLSKINEVCLYDNLLSQEDDPSKEVQQDEEIIIQAQFEQLQLSENLIQSQTKQEEEQQQIIVKNEEEEIFDKINNLEYQDKDIRVLIEDQNILLDKQESNYQEIFSQKEFYQESQQEVEKTNLNNNSNQQHSDNSEDICEQLQKLTIQDIESENEQEIDLNNNHIQQQVNLEDIETNKQCIFQEDVNLQLEQTKLQSENNQEEHQEPTQCEEDQGFCNKEIIEAENSPKIEQKTVMLNLNCNDEEMEQIQQQAKNVFQPQINNFSQQNEKMDQDIEQTEDHQMNSNSQQNEEGTLSKNQQDSDLTNDLINNQPESNQKKQSIKLIDHSEQNKDSQQEENILKSQKHEEKQGDERQNVTFSSQKKSDSQKEGYFLSQSKIQFYEDSLNQNQFNTSLSQNQKEYNSSKSNDQTNFDLGHAEQYRDTYFNQNSDDLQEQRKQKIRDLKQQIDQAESEIIEKDQEIQQNQEMITNFETFVLGNTNPEEFEKIILSERNFETENLLITLLINKLREFIQEFQNSIIDLINRFDGKTEIEKDEEYDRDRETKDHEKHLQVISNEFKKFKQKKQQKKEINDNKNQVVIQNLGEADQKIINEELNTLIFNIIGQTKLLRDSLQKNCCLLVKFNCEVYNGLQGMSKNIKQLEQIRRLTNSVKLTTQHYQSIINDQIDLQEAKDDNNHILLLDLLKQLIHKQEQAFQFQQLFTNYLSERIDLVHQSEENLREDMAKRLQTFN